MLIIIFHMKMNGKIAYGGRSYVEKNACIALFLPQYRKHTGWMHP